MVNQCHATAKATGKRCNRAAILGGRVCYVHGGAAPQVKRKAAERIAALRDAACDVLKRHLQAGEVEPIVCAKVIKEFTELVETLEGRVARREEQVSTTQYDDLSDEEDAQGCHRERIAAVRVLDKLSAVLLRFHLRPDGEIGRHARFRF